MSPNALKILGAAADNHLYSLSGIYGRVVDSSTGEVLSANLVDSLQGLGLLAPAGALELIPGRSNEWGQRIDLTEVGLERYLAVAG